MVLRGISNASGHKRRDDNPIRFGKRRERASSSAHASHLVATEEEYLGFQIVYQRRKQGVTMTRAQFSAVIASNTLAQNIYLSGFPDQSAARDAAHRRIDANATPVVGIPPIDLNATFDKIDRWWNSLDDLVKRKKAI